jgi:hypothetical protein
MTFIIVKLFLIMVSIVYSGTRYLKQGFLKIQSLRNLIDHSSGFRIKMKKKKLLKSSKKIIKKFDKFDKFENRN